MDSITVLRGETVNIPTTIPSAFGWNFMGWDANGTVYQPGATLTLTENMTLYARWNSREIAYAWDDLWGLSHTIAYPGQGVYFNFTVPETGIYRLKGASGFDTKISVYDSYGNLYLSDDDSGGDLQFKVEASFEADETYVVYVQPYSNTATGTLYWNIQKGIPVCYMDSLNNNSSFEDGYAFAETQDGKSWSVTQTTTVPTKAGYTFLGWSIYTNDTSGVQAPGQKMILQYADGDALPWEGGWTYLYAIWEESPVTELQTGDQVVIYAPAYNKALSVTKTGHYNVGVDVTVTDGTVTGYGDTEVFTVTVNDDGTYSFANGGQNLGMADTYSTMNLGAVNDKWVLTALYDGLYNVQNAVRGNYMEWYDYYSNWNTYNSTSAATNDQFQLSFYVVDKGIFVGEVALPEGSDPNGTELTIVEANEKGAAMTSGTYTITKYEVTGVIDEIYNTTYGNMYINDGAGNRLLIYGTWDGTGTIRFDALDPQPAVGDTVTLLGAIGNHNGTAQMKNGQILVHIPASDAPAVLTGIVVKTLPSKTTYWVGEKLELSGLSLTATYDDGSTEAVAGGFMTYGFSSDTAGTKTVTVDYEGFTTTFTVVVKDVALTGIEVKTLPTKTTYWVGEKLELSGLSLTASYSDGSTATVTGGFSVSGFSSAAAGSNTVMVYYEGQTATFTVTVNEPELTGITINSVPTKLEYMIGENLDTTGLELLAIYSDGSAVVVSSGFTVSGFDSVTAGTKTVTVTYEGTAATFDVTVLLTGTCGESVTWSIEEGTLIISGTGAMYDYEMEAGAPWSAYNDQIEMVLIGAGVTYIGEYAFYASSALSAVSIETDLQTVGAAAFASCDWLEEIYYNGTHAQWATITIEEGNDPLTSATLYALPEPATPVEAPTDKDIFFAIDFGSSLTVNTLITKSVLDQFDSYSVKLTVEGKDPVVMTSGNSYVSGGVEYCEFPYENLTVLDVALVVNVELTVTKDGQSYTAYDQRSLEEFCNKSIENGTDDAVPCAFLLQYAQAAAAYKGVTGVTLSDAAAAVIEGATTIKDALPGDALREKQNGEQISIVGQSLDMTARIAINYHIDLSSYQGDTDAITVKVTYGTDGCDTYTFADLVYNESDDLYEVSFSKFLATQMDEVVTCTVYIDGVEEAYFTTGVARYCRAVLNSTSQTEQMQELARCIYRYGLACAETY